MAGYIGNKSSVTLVDGYSEAEANAEFVNDPNSVITVSGSNVGIGTVSPIAPLDVTSSGYGTLAVLQTTGSHGFEISAPTSATLQIASKQGSKNLDLWANTLSFSAGSSERMRIDSSGNVGIGISDPTFSNGYNGLEIGGNSNSVMKVSCTVASGWAYSEYAINDTTKWITGLQGSTNAYRIAYGTNIQNDAKFSVMSDGYVGIGTNSPSSYYANHLVVDTGSSVQSGITIVSDTGNQGMLAFADGTTGDARYRGAIDYNHSSDSMAFLSAGSEAMRIDSSGRVLMNTTSTIDAAPSAMFQVYNPTSVSAVFQTDNAGSQVIGAWNKGDSGTRYLMWFESSIARTSVGSITTNGTSTSYNTSSDYRLKEAWVPMIGASERVLDLNPVNFAWKADGSRVDGFLAHELAEVTPEAVHGTKDAMRDEEYEVTPAIEATYAEDGSVLTEAVPAVMGTRSVPDYQGIDQSKLVPLLTAALQEALTEITDLKARVTTLEAV